ncbi:MAG: DUF1573 domain-containing protein [Deltaproteobacteria bacterium]|jgi:hypothetical protein|nr:DUF1573 domain-containing protein [Deltaproteobacteria bacterium]
MTFRSFLKWQIIFIVGFVLALFPIVSQADTPEAKPVMEIPSPRHDAGSHWEGEKVSHAFEVRNTGNGELRILSVKPG